MATGYTEIIETKADLTLREFALRCARAFGACIMQRDEDIDVPPRPREPSDYHVKALAKARRELAELDGIRPDSARAMWEAECARIRENNARWAADHAKTSTAYARMRSLVEAWRPPTKDHEGLKRFMLEQIEVGGPQRGGPFAITPPASPEEYVKDLRESAERDVTYHTEEHKKELDRAAESHKWLAMLSAALPEGR